MRNSKIKTKIIMQGTVPLIVPVTPKQPKPSRRKDNLKSDERKTT